MSNEPYAQPSIDEVLAGCATSYWLKHAIETALQRDPVDAARDADILARLLRRRRDEILNFSTPVR